MRPFLLRFGHVRGIPQGDIEHMFDKWSAVSVPPERKKPLFKLAKIKKSKIDLTDNPN